ncbi:uncharacterized protein BJ171DRAFT_505924 [Polychytrium aggregatum]|uniref:uncharacterized protein n=1 Tax=Polychytrium aggregatum TaxID=110093 RepID=UPI0022FE4A9C|nr:uncharacterized protein BJ171DRAFT_505924 [Polychytrium aggregatum]KAI9204482.1 hypothetical protein BJ171DRAFT_505924 [Polychytrium aggregatum]
MLGWMHYLGRGTVRDEQKGVKIIRDNRSDKFELGEHECLASLWSRISTSAPAPCKFHDLCQLGSEHDWLCMHLLAVCQFFGFGTFEDREQAERIFEQLANDSHSDSQFWLGSLEFAREIVAESFSKSFPILYQSANQGNSYGQWIIGEHYIGGAGVTKDDTKAAEWFRKSAEQGNQRGQSSLGICYMLGRGVTQDFDAAVFWIRKAAEQGHQGCIEDLEKLDLWP